VLHALPIASSLTWSSQHTELKLHLFCIGVKISLSHSEKNMYLACLRTRF
jgi:hypothetical protein